MPWVSERIDLPPGMRVTGVEVTGLETRTLATGAQIAPALAPTPGLGPEERSKPDPLYFQASTPQPEQVASLGAQGGLRGRSVAWLQVAPARWNPATGEVSLVTKVSVRLTLDTDPGPPLVRERIVREWEDRDALPSGVPSRAMAAALTSVTPGGKGKAAPFRATQVPSVLGSPVEYVIVTNDAMAPTFQQLADWKTQSGVPAVVRTVSFIPLPSSATLNRTNVPIMASGTCSLYFASITASSAVMVSGPPRGMASRAFTARLMTICSKLTASANTGGRFSAHWICK